ncbi:MAG: 4Fe-4S cluster-binding domain-containing protein [Acidobacteria bacterium]|nr:4Fe-4S cluster-binding domain-containing protein [Acidobacteriota bacterium]
MSTPLTQSSSDPGGRQRVKYVRRLDHVPEIPADVRARLQPVTEEYVFRANDYYLRLIDWNDPDDPIRQLIIPREEELNDWGRLDASNEQAVTVARGVQHKYFDTVLLLCNEVCGAYCRYCFRKRLFMDDNDEVTNDVSAGLAYIAAHPEVSNVLLTGGDPLLMSTRRLVEIFEALRAIDHVRIIRIGSKMPAFDPWRVLRDEELQAAFRKYSTPERRIYLMAHFDHPRELTDPAVEGIDACLRNGVICVNQCPLIRGVNDDAATLSEMYSRLSYIGCPPYYLFQGRPTAGNEPYEVPIVRGWHIFQDALRRGSGLARRAKYCMSHASGKVEIVGVDSERIYLRYHQAKDPADLGRFFVRLRDDRASWLDDLVPAEEPILAYEH